MTIQDIVIVNHERFSASYKILICSYGQNSKWFPIFSMFPCLKCILFPITFINSFMKLPVHCIYIMKEWKCFLPIYVGRHISSQFKAQYNKCCLSSLSNFWQEWFIGTEWMYKFAKRKLMQNQGHCSSIKKTLPRENGFWQGT